MTPEQAIAALNKLTGWDAKTLEQAVEHVGIKLSAQRSAYLDACEDLETLRLFASKEAVQQAEEETLRLTRQKLYNHAQI